MDNRNLILAGSEILGVIAIVLLASLSKSIRQRALLGFKYPRREAVVSLSLFSLLLLAAILFYTGVIPTPTPLLAVTSTLWQQLLAGLVALLVIMLALYIRQQPIRSAGWSKAMFGPSSRLGLALVFLTIFLRGAIFKLMDGVSTPEIAGLLVWLVIALAEETVFRGLPATAADFIPWRKIRLAGNRGHLFYLAAAAPAAGSRNPLDPAWDGSRTGSVVKLDDEAQRSCFGNRALSGSQ